MHRRHRAGHRRFVRVVPEGHDVFLLVLFPLKEGQIGGIDIKAGVIRLRDQLPHIVTLVADAAVIILDRVLGGLACDRVGLHRGLIRQGDLAHDLITHPPGLGVKHVERVPLVLHADVEHLGVFVPNHALVEIGRRQPVRRLQAQVVGQEREVVLVAGAKDDRVDLLAGAILEMRGAGSACQLSGQA